MNDLRPIQEVVIIEIIAKRAPRELGWGHARLLSLCALDTPAIPLPLPAPHRPAWTPSGPTSTPQNQEGLIEIFLGRKATTQ